MKQEEEAREPARLTVWCKSLLFNAGHGYTVFDDDGGEMVFRVDNYDDGSWRRRDTVLMDAAGHALLTIRRRRKILSIRGSWEVYKGDQAEVKEVVTGERRKPLFEARRHLVNTSCALSMSPPASVGGPGMPREYWMSSWSRQTASSKIYQAPAAAAGPLVAEVKRKHCDADKGRVLVDKDVFSLEVQPGMDQALVMAMLSQA